MSQEGKYTLKVNKVGENTYTCTGRDIVQACTHSTRRWPLVLATPTTWAIDGGALVELGRMFKKCAFTLTIDADKHLVYVTIEGDPDFISPVQVTMRECVGLRKDRVSWNVEGKLYGKWIQNQEPYPDYYADYIPFRKKQMEKVASLELVIDNQ